MKTLLTRFHSLGVTSNAFQKSRGSSDVGVPKTANTLWAALALMFAAFLGVSSDCSSQTPYDHTTFLNGFASDSLIWRTGYQDLAGQTTPGYLGNSIILKTPIYPNVNDSLTYSQQIARILPVFSGGQHIIVAHSLGSLVGRGLYINNPTVRPNVTGIITLVAPHQGAPIAQNGGEALRFFADVERRVNGAITLIRIDAVVLDILGWFTPGAHWLMLIGNIILVKTSSQTLTLGNVGAALMAPALPSLIPGSPTVQSLNNNFADGSLPRANIYATIPHYRAVIRLASSFGDQDANFNQNVDKFNKGIADFKVCKYVAYATIVFSSTGRACAYAVKVLKRVDGRWVGYVNGWDAYGNPKDVPFDGIVPNEKSNYPTTNGLAYNANVVGLNHINVYKTRLGLDQVVTGMRRIGMLPVGTPPAPLSVSIAGPPSHLTIGCPYDWSATAAGGVPPYTYAWTVNGAAYNTNGAPYLSYAPRGPRLSIKATVTGADNASAFAVVSYAPTPGAC